MFETYTARPKNRRTPAPFVSVSPAGLLGINARAWNALGRPPAVALAYDRDLDLLRITRADPNDTGAFPTGSKAAGVSIPAAPFFTAYRLALPAEVARLDPYEWVPGDTGPDGLIVDLGALR